jgi:hypothetical protein
MLNLFFGLFVPNFYQIKVCRANTVNFKSRSGLKNHHGMPCKHSKLNYIETKELNSEDYYFCE